MVYYDSYNYIYKLHTYIDKNMNSVHLLVIVLKPFHIQCTEAYVFRLKSSLKFVQRLD